MRVRAMLGVALALAAMVLSAMVLPGCGGGSGTSDESRVRGKYSALARALERERVDEVMLLFSPNYLDNGYSYVDVRNSTAELFDQFSNISVSHVLHDVRVSGDFATVFGTEIIDANDTFDNNVLKHSETDFNDVWHYEHGDWYLYGDQRQSVTATRTAPFRWSPQRMRAAPAK